MQTLREIERAIEKLPQLEQRKLASWLRERDADAWDEEIEQDARNGRLDTLVAEAEAAIDAGRAAKMP